MTQLPNITEKVRKGWNKAVNKYGANASIEDLREVKKSLEPLLGEVQEDFPYRLGRMLYGWTHPIEEALRWACRDGHTETVKLILDFSRENFALMKGFYWACYYGNTEIAKLILDFSRENDTIDLNARDRRGMAAFHQACRYGRTETVELILEYSQGNDAIDLNVRDNEGMTGFDMACMNGYTETAKLILENWKEFGIDINVQDIGG